MAEAEPEALPILSRLKERIEANKSGGSETVYVADKGQSKCGCSKSSSECKPANQPNCHSSCKSSGQSKCQPTCNSCTTAAPCGC